MLLHTLVDDTLWYALQPLRFGPLRFTSRMTIVRLDDGTLWVHSPARPSTGLVAEIDALGTVRDAVAPNRAHHRFLVPFLAAFPRARGWVAPGLGHGRPEFEHLQSLDAHRRQQWRPGLRGVLVEGLPRLNEILWFHAPTRTLIVTDLLQCFGADNPWLTRLAARAAAHTGAPAMGRHLRLLVRDRAALRRSVESVLELDFGRMLLAHDQMVEGDARAAFAGAFDWLLRDAQT